MTFILEAVHLLCIQLGKGVIANVLHSITRRSLGDQGQNAESRKQYYRMQNCRLDTGCSEESVTSNMSYLYSNFVSGVCVCVHGYF